MEAFVRWTADRGQCGRRTTSDHPHMSSRLSLSGAARRCPYGGGVSLSFTSPPPCELCGPRSGDGRPCIRALSARPRSQSGFFDGSPVPAPAGEAPEPRPPWPFATRAVSCRPPPSVVNPETLWAELAPFVATLGSAQRARVRHALDVAFEAHTGQKRKSGEPYIVHPVEVARMLAELGMDPDTIIAGLLHDTVEDTATVTFARIEAEFGPAVRRIVEGETKMSKVSSDVAKVSSDRGPRDDASVADVKADDLRQMFLAMTEEVRVIIVKLADRLHNMRTLGHMPPAKQQRIADETLVVFAPLARLLGMYRIQAELEDLAFRYAQPALYRSLQARVAAVCDAQAAAGLEAQRMLRAALARDPFVQRACEAVELSLSARELWEIYSKAQAAGGYRAEDVVEVSQLRVVLTLRGERTDGGEDPGDASGHAPGEDPCVTPMQVCYHVMGQIHSMWPPVPGKMKDYISTPKPNGYQSLHTTVLPLGSGDLFPLEVHIRTARMHALAETGIAARRGAAARWGASPHAADGGDFAGEPWVASPGVASCSAVGPLDSDDLRMRVSWLTAIREWQDEFVTGMSAREFVDTITGDLLGQRVFVFSPAGGVVSLPAGSTVIDYAYHVATAMGNAMVGAKVNGQLVPPEHVLVNAEVVEIVACGDRPPGLKEYTQHAQWLKWAHTRAARYKIGRFLRDQEARLRLLPGFGASSLAARAQADLAVALGERLLDGTLSIEPDADRPLGGDTHGGNGNGNGNGNVAAEGNGHAGGNGNGVAPGGEVSTASANGNGHSAGPTASLSGLDDGLSSSPGERPLWLRITCHDRNGLLADVTSAISAHGFSIKAYAGASDVSDGFMSFELAGGAKPIEALVWAIHAVPGVISFSTGCSLAPDSPQAPPSGRTIRGGKR